MVSIKSLFIGLVFALTAVSAAPHHAGKRTGTKKPATTNGLTSLTNKPATGTATTGNTNTNVTKAKKVPKLKAKPAAKGPKV